MAAAVEGVALPDGTIVNPVGAVACPSRCP